MTHWFRHRILLAATVVLSTVPAALAHEGIAEQIRQITSRIRQNPDSAALYLQRGELYRLHREWAAAATDFDDASRLDPSLDAIQLARGRLELDSGHPAAALEPLSRFLEHNPGHADAFVLRAEARMRSGDRSGAMDDYATAIRQPTPPEPDWYLQLAKLIERDGRPAEALSVLDQGMARIGEAATLELRAIDLAVALERYGDALDRLDRLASRSQRQETWLARRGDILEKAGRRKEARQAWKAALLAIEHLPPAQRTTRASRTLRARLSRRLSETADR